MIRRPRRRRSKQTSPETTSSRTCRGNGDHSQVPRSAPPRRARARAGTAPASGGSASRQSGAEQGEGMGNSPPSELVSSAFPREDTRPFRRPHVSTNGPISLLKNVGWTPRPSEFQWEITDEASVLRVFQQAVRAVGLLASHQSPMTNQVFHTDFDVDSRSRRPLDL